jgi:hypothetical protein
VSAYFLRCAVCDWRAPDESAVEGLTACPQCDSTGIPLGPDNDLTIAVNWQELRVLVMWAERWGSQYERQDAFMLPLVRAIARRIEGQHPELSARLPLTFLGEVQQLRGAFGQVEQNVVSEELDLSLPPSCALCGAMEGLIQLGSEPPHYLCGRCRPVEAEGSE